MSEKGWAETELLISLGSILDKLTRLFGLLRPENLRRDNSKLATLRASAAPILREICRSLDWIHDYEEERKARLVLNHDQFLALARVKINCGSILVWMSEVTEGLTTEDTNSHMALEWKEVQHAAEVLNQLERPPKSKTTPSRPKGMLKWEEQKADADLFEAWCDFVDDCRVTDVRPLHRDFVKTLKPPIDHKQSGRRVRAFREWLRSLANQYAEKPDSESDAAFCDRRVKGLKPGKLKALLELVDNADS